MRFKTITKNKYLLTLLENRQYKNLRKYAFSVFFIFSEIEFFSLYMEFIFQLAFSQSLNSFFYQRSKNNLHMFCSQE